MKTLLPTMLALCLVACVAPQPLIPIAAKPEISVLHVSGKIVSVPPNSKWPGSIKIGARFDYWAVLDNRVRDENSSPQEGSFPQKAWPARYDLRVGDFRFSSDRLNPPTFSVSTYHARQGSSDGYSICSGASGRMDRSKRSPTSLFAQELAAHTISSCCSR